MYLLKVIVFNHDLAISKGFKSMNSKALTSVSQIYSPQTLLKFFPCLYLSGNQTDSPTSFIIHGFLNHYIDLFKRKNAIKWMSYKFNHFRLSNLPWWIFSPRCRLQIHLLKSFIISMSIRQYYKAYQQFVSIIF